MAHDAFAEHWSMHTAALVHANEPLSELFDHEF
jgi:hypothetical protein